MQRVCSFLQSWTEWRLSQPKPEPGQTKLKTAQLAREIAAAYEGVGHIYVPYAGKTYVATMSFKEPEKLIWHNSALANLTVWVLFSSPQSKFCELVKLIWGDLAFKFYGIFLQPVNIKLAQGRDAEQDLPELWIVEGAVTSEWISEKLFGWRSLCRGGCAMETQLTCALCHLFMQTQFAVWLRGTAPLNSVIGAVLLKRNHQSPVWKKVFSDQWLHSFAGFEPK